MGTFSLLHWIIVIGMMAAYFVPLVKILQKAGYSGWWSVVTLVPVLNLIMFYVFAFADWPSLRGSARQ